jgi:hypothetical protein
MPLSATLLISFGFVINVADTIPRYDLKPTCRAAVNLAAGTSRVQRMAKVTISIFSCA